MEYVNQLQRALGVIEEHKARLIRRRRWTEIDKLWNNARVKSPAKDLKAHDSKIMEESKHFENSRIVDNVYARFHCLKYNCIVAVINTNIEYR